MTVTEAIRARRSIRRYKDGEISDEHLKLILEAAMCCPSARNMRPYEFKVVKSAEKRRELSALSANFKMLATAACTGIVCGRPDLEEGMGHEFWQQDCSAATENILFYDGRGHKLDDVTFHIPEDDYMKMWTFSSSDGRFEMEFEPVLDRTASMSAFLVSSDQHQVFGKMTGKAILDGGKFIELKDFMCFAEKVHNRY